MRQPPACHRPTHQRLLPRLAPGADERTDGHARDEYRRVECLVADLLVFFLPPISNAPNKHVRGLLDGFLFDFSALKLQGTSTKGFEVLLETFVVCNRCIPRRLRIPFIRSLTAKQLEFFIDQIRTTKEATDSTIATRLVCTDLPTVVRIRRGFMAVRIGLPPGPGSSFDRPLSGGADCSLASGTFAPKGAERSRLSGQQSSCAGELQHRPQPDWPDRCPVANSTDPDPGSDGAAPASQARGIRLSPLRPPLIGQWHRPGGHLHRRSWPLRFGAWCSSVLASWEIPSTGRGPRPVQCVTQCHQIVAPSPARIAHSVDDGGVNIRS